MIDNLEAMQEQPGQNKIVQINEAALEQRIDAKIREGIETTLNTLLDEQADRIAGAGRYERSENRRDTRAGHYERKLHTRGGEVTLRVPKLRTLAFETGIIERYKRRESSVEEALIEMYYAGVSVRRVEEITEALWGTRVSPQTVSELNQKLGVRLEEWRNRPLSGEHPYVYLDGIYLRRNWAGEVRNISMLVAFGVNLEGFREVLGVMEGGREDEASWLAFLRHLKARGLSGVKYIVSDKCLGLVESLGQVFPEASWQRCAVHFYRNVFAKAPKEKIRAVADMLKAIHAQESIETAREKAAQVVAKMQELKLREAAKVVAEGIEETFAYYRFPREHWRKVRTNNPMERVMKEIRRRTNVVGAFPDGNAALLLVCARLRHITTSEWGTRKYLDVGGLEQHLAAAG